MTRLKLNDVEKWESRAWTSLFCAIGFSIAGALSVWWLVPRINIHSPAGLMFALAALSFGGADAIAGAVGLVSASVLYLRNQIISWRGILSAITAALFWFWAWASTANQ